MKKIRIEKLKEFCVEALVKTGTRPADAETIAEVLATTDAFGVNSHGTKNLYEYILKEQAGGLSATAVPEIVKEGPSWALFDAHMAMGMVGAAAGMRAAIEKARKTGIGYAAVRNSCHFGAAGYYANMAAEAGMIGLAMSNADPTMTIPNGRGVSIGNNPFSYAAPLPGGRSVFLDVALSSVAALKVVLAQAKNAPVPDNWLVDEAGAPTTDASGFPKTAHLQPMAAHKGYGLAVMVEILSSVLLGAEMLSAVHSWNLDLSVPNRASHAFIAVDVSQMTEGDGFLSAMQELADELHHTAPAAGRERVFLPGEMEWEKREKAEKEGLILTDAMVTQLLKLSEMTGIAIPWTEE